ncbi:MAG: hypothetical protein ABSB95_13815 [Dissulfurispiraceae bacterium]|jgi:hypothetical protein
MMLNDKHREAEDLSAAAAIARAQGRREEAVELYSRAAKAEEAALSEVSRDKARTRSILSLSLASFLYKAELLDAAEIKIFQLLGDGSLEEWADRQLRELLQVVSDEKMLVMALRRRYSGETITVALRGGEIGQGTGPLDLILEKAAGFQSLLYRFAEWVGKYPLRLRGNPPKDLMEFIQARASEPALGSYRIEIRLTEPLQMEMFESSRVQPQAVSDIMFEFFTKLTEGPPEKLEELVPQSDYRKAFLQLTRNLTPAGRRLKEIGIYRQHQSKIQSVFLTDALPRKIQEAFPRKEKDSQEPRIKLNGVLRALHLDKNWLEITRKDGERIRCDTVHDMLDDVVGPMVNREVIVSGAIRPRRGGVKRLIVEEIELAEES